MKQSHWLLWVVKNREWSRKITPLSHLNGAVAFRGVKLKTYSESSIKLRNLQILKKLPETSSQFLSSEQPCEPKSLDVALNNAGAEKNTSGKLAVAVNIGGHSIRLLNARSVSAGEISVLCHWRFSNSLI